MSSGHFILCPGEVEKTKEIRVVGILQIRCIAKSGHYLVYVGSQSEARHKWPDVYPSIPFETVTVTSEVVY